jgi:hypothetical protein
MSIATGIPAPLRRAALLGNTTYLALFLGVHVVLATAPDGLTPADVAELVLVAAPAAALTLLRTIRIPVAIGCLLSLVAAATIGTWSLPPVAQSPDYRAWSFGAVTFVTLLLAFREHYLEAWLTLLCTAAVAIGWSLDVGLGPLVGVGLVVRHFGTLLAGSLFSFAYARSQRSALAFEAAERQDRVAAEAAAARHAARQVAAREVLEQAGPLLERLAEGRPLSDEDRRELLVVEGALRDRIRAAGLLRDSLPARVAEARRRGMDVLLLDEAADTLGDEERTRAAAWLAERLASAGGRRFVGRLGTREGVPRVTAVTDEGSDFLLLPHGELTVR